MQERAGEPSDPSQALTVALREAAGRPPAGLADRLIVHAVTTVDGSHRRPRTWLAPSLAAAAVVAVCLAVLLPLTLGGGASDVATRSSGPVLAPLPTAAPVMSLRTLPPSTGQPPTAPARSTTTAVCQAVVELQSGSGTAPPVTVDADPISVTAVWIPGLNSSPCRASLTTGDQALARTLAAAVRSADPSSGISNCEDDGAAAILYFRYPDQTLAEVVEIGLSGCGGITAPDRAGRNGIDTSLLKPIAPAGFATYLHN